ncbi:hypothetical protein IscW_ISCW008778 [Ixodes scapularis]|uniref:CCHC-type domain-containing protein n=1 Tax=Ixodes scapularis TaxID=6945 RepID=B7PXI6_IXOSC|nr:hypothetical protein IscW_ISCW008778 [Ixodes scapularis]|eukprot:XP_002400963.1 hypothetical protein IscW_ISCW008778 [Ixodes scapularis]
MRPVTRNAASSTVTNNEEDGGNQDKGEKTGNELPTPSGTGPDTALDVTAIVQAAVHTAGASSSPLTSRRRFENGADRATGSKSEARRESVDPPPLRRRKKPLFNERGETLCFNCDDYGHVSMNCPSPQRKALCGVC